MMMPSPVSRIRSYVIRGRRTTAQADAHRVVWPQFGLAVAAGVIDYPTVFARTAPRFLEIGFGSGASLLALAQAQPQHDFIGIETHQPGIGAVCMGIQSQQLTNLRLYQEDALDVLEQAIPAESLDGVQIFFPDPWPKRRHRERRLIQASFTSVVVSKIKPGGLLHLATDWDDYAVQMMQVLSQESQIANVAGPGQFASRSSQRPIITRFEQRALQAGRSIQDLAFIKL